ncbi:histidinol dehydrogenase [uncultured Rikenella sp.]|uniref:histidinol dehydrogenase n=1 Tax=uncultured Rikenella sp. TaxID=368003 RepID=UPI002611D5AE|nr:histidinol dehydrogenase [uncultured Rikenella sp.]
MKTYIQPPRTAWEDLLARPLQQENETIRKRVENIIERVRKDRDAALRELADQFDGVKIDSPAVTDDEIAKADELLDDALKNAIRQARENIIAFHRAQRMEPIRIETMPGVCCEQRSVTIHSVGLYVPGGRAPLFSTVLMLAVPAQIAGCKEIVLCTPPRRDGTVAPEILWTAQLCGVTRIFKVGGAQAVAAMAFGTESVPRVNKIFGPGNRYVTTAKQLLGLSAVAIDMPAGPSEVMVLADDTARADFVAADLLSQAEHGPDSQAILVTTSPALATAVETEVSRQLALLGRAEIATQALAESRIFVVASEAEMVEMANLYAAEHLIVETAEPEAIAALVENAGSIFLGHYSPESVGDYASGTNHTLPTSGWAAAYSGVNLDSFCKKITFQRLTPEGLRNIGGTVEQMATAEGLDAHRNAVTIRLNSLK